MALPETFYAVVSETDSIPPQYDWYHDLDGAKTDVVDSAENESETFVVYEIMIRQIYRTRTTVELEKI